MAADIVRRNLYDQTMAEGDLSVIQVGTNDQRWYGSNPTKKGYTLDGLRNVIVWLATSTKTKARDVGGETGSWSNTVILGIGRTTSQAGATKTFVSTGTVAYLSILCSDNNVGATYEILKNGISIGTFTSNATGVTTYNGWPYVDRLHRITGLTPGDTITAKNLGGNFYVQWFADNNQIVKPKVFFANIIRKTSAAYAQWGGSDENVVDYNAGYTALESELKGDGLDVTMVDVHSALNNSTDPITGHLHPADGVHPSNLGHSVEKDVFYAKITGQQQPQGQQTFQAAPIYRRLIDGVPDGTYWIDDGEARRQITIAP